MLGRLGYALLFCVLLPAALVAWARAMDAVISLPMPAGSLWSAAGWAIAAIGLAITTWSMVQLRVETGGLPMNAFPPPRWAVGGPFTWLAHPIYTGYVVLVGGASMALGSAAGFWIVTPVMALACAALVWGYERDDLRKRLGPRPCQPLLARPISGDEPPRFREQLGVLVLIFAPWLVLYEAIGHLPVPDAIEVFMPIEREWPVVEWTELVYAMTYPFVLSAVFAARTRSDLRRFVSIGLVGMVVGFWCYLSLPLIAPPRPFEPTSWLGHLLMLERADGLAGRAACPSFHVFWTVVAAWMWLRRGRIASVVAVLLAAGIIISCVTTGMHAIVDLAAGAALALIALRWPNLWRRMLSATERVANGWWQFRIGPARLLVHAVYAFAAAASGALLASTLAGDWRGVAIVAICGLLGAAIWGQLVTGGSGLARPFGYFGHVLGSVVGLVMASVLIGDVWMLGAAIAAAAPLVQAVGRLRCLVQGCCHGRLCTDAGGIRYHDARSRVLKFTGLGGRSLHATPLYSILSNLLMLGLLLRLWSVGAPASFVVGSYLLLSGLARFVEEHYRGEPRTPIRAGLRLYQWLAVASVVSGAGVVSIPTGGVVWPMHFETITIVPAVFVGLVYAFAMGVDFPESARRFARLA
ncbi:MAG: phosphatase PAP2 family protein [Phycisphaeraceae bacterium]|nr:phosphatase PAP2 family protein [Phycisphaeraceae bacterium]